mgnify:CR=1 FL=1
MAACFLGKTELLFGDEIDHRLRDIEVCPVVDGHAIEGVNSFAFENNVLVDGNCISTIGCGDFENRVEFVFNIDVDGHSGFGQLGFGDEQRSGDFVHVISESLRSILRQLIVVDQTGYDVFKGRRVDIVRNIFTGMAGGGVTDQRAF